MRLWTCYLAGVILRLGSFPVTLRGGRRCALLPAPPHPLLASWKFSGDASRGEALRPSPCIPHPLFSVGSGEAVDRLCSGCYLVFWKLSSNASRGEKLSGDASRGEALDMFAPARLRRGRRCALPPAPPTRFYRLAPARLWTCSLAGVILHLGSFPVTLRGGRRCALPPAPPTRFFRLAPVRLWTCYLAGVIRRLGWAMDM